MKKLSAEAKLYIAQVASQAAEIFAEKGFTYGFPVFQTEHTPTKPELEQAIIQLLHSLNKNNMMVSSGRFAVTYEAGVNPFGFKIWIDLSVPIHENYMEA